MTRRASSAAQLGPPTRLVLVIVLGLLVAGCDRGADRARPVAPPPAPHGAPAPGGPPHAVAGCPPEWPPADHRPAAQLLPLASAVCVSGRRFDQLDARRLIDALGSDVRSAPKPMCASGYPVVLLLTDAGERMNLVFCAQEGATHAYAAGERIAVRDPAAVDAWLRWAGAQVPARAYPP